LKRDVWTAFSNFKTISPQGDGNHKTNLLSAKTIKNFKTISPQGDGNNNYMRNNSLQEISKPYPRKGTETLIISPNHKTTYKNFKTISPQGDGNFSLITQSKPSPLYFKTISPQGDGNKVLDIVQSCWLRKFQNHIPARGRKQLPPNIQPLALQSISKPYPRKGTETMGIPGICPIIAELFQNHIPARGRKLRFVSNVCNSNMNNFKTISPQGDGNITS